MKSSDLRDHNAIQSNYNVGRMNKGLGGWVYMNVTVELLLKTELADSNLKCR